ncbi:MAG TPA: hypothetical protein VF499_06370 [Afipia sp.]
MDRSYNCCGVPAPLPCEDRGGNHKANSTSLFKSDGTMLHCDGSDKELARIYRSLPAKRAMAKTASLL